MKTVFNILLIIMAFWLNSALANCKEDPNKPRSTAAQRSQTHNCLLEAINLLSKRLYVLEQKQIDLEKDARHSSSDNGILLAGYVDAYSNHKKDEKIDLGAGFDVERPFGGSYFVRYRKPIDIDHIVLISFWEGKGEVRPTIAPGTQPRKGDLAEARKYGNPSYARILKSIPTGFEVEGLGVRTRERANVGFNFVVVKVKK